MWTLSSPTRDWTHTSALEAWSLNHWTTREVPKQKDLYKSKVTERVLWAQSTAQRTEPTAFPIHSWSTYQIQFLADGSEIASLGQGTEGISNLSWERNLCRVLSKVYGLTMLLWVIPFRKWQDCLSWKSRTYHTWRPSSELITYTYSWLPETDQDIHCLSLLTQSSSFYRGPTLY